ncbi:MAG: TIR domain-containing protein [Proteobacteria bacterium]|nr:TIR domain-containing protein [Pseudomonadota bacterium]
MADIFFSYASKDRDRIAPLVETFKAQGWSVWWDQHIVPGSSFDDMIEQAIAEAACVVVAWTKTSVNADWVRREALFGLEKDILIPVLLDDIELPFAFRRTQAAKLIGWPQQEQTNGDLERLLQGIRQTLGSIREVKEELVPRGDERPSIAVLPLDDLTNDTTLLGLADGMTEDIITHLAQNPTFFVAARNSSYQFKGGASDVREVGRALTVRYVLEGSVRKVGNNLRVVAQLIEVETGGHIWTDIFNESVEDIGAAQDILTEKISNAVASAAGNDNFQRILRTPREELGPWGLLALAAASPVNNREGRERRQTLIRSAIALDPSSGVAHVRLADVLAQDVVADLSEDPDADRKLSLSEIESALRLAPGNAAVLAIAATAYMNLGEKRRSISLARRTLVLAPIPPSHMTLANVLLRADEAEEAKSIFEALAEKAPKGLGLNHRGLTIACCILGDYERALSHAEEWELWSPGEYSACLIQANLLSALGENDAALVAIEKLREKVPRFRLEEGIESLEKGNTGTARERLTGGLKIMLERERSTD